MRYKIIITGPVGAGKTTAINALTNDKALKTDVPVSEMTTSQRKQTTTVALDYGVIKLNEEDVAHVYGTPGQERFDFMWEILSEGAHGLIILLDNSRNYPLRDLKFYVGQFSELIQKVPVLIGITRTDEKSDPDLATHQEWASELKLNAKVFAVDARDKSHIEMLVTEILQTKKDPQSDRDALSAETPSSRPADLKATSDVGAGTAITQSPQSEPAAEKTQSHISSQTTIKLSEKSMAAVTKIKGVTGASLSNDMGELLNSTINDSDLNEFIAFLSGITPAVEDAAQLGKIHRIMLRGPKDDNPTIFVEAEHSLGVTSHNKTSIPALSQQIEDMLQWM